MSAVSLTIDEFGRRLRAREITAEQMTEECLRRIDVENPRLNAFILIMADQARRQARDADRELSAGRDRGALHGVPISIKDLLDVRGTPTTAASRVREGHVAGTLGIANRSERTFTADEVTLLGEIGDKIGRAIAERPEPASH